MIGVPPNALAPINYLAAAASLSSRPRGGLSLLDLAPPYNALAAAQRQTPSLLGETPLPVPPFRQPYTEADFARELQRPFWVADDIAPLLCGIDPIFATPHILREFEFKDPIARELIRLRCLIFDAQQIGDLEVRARPSEAINWALKQYIDVHADLIKLALARGMPIRGRKSDLQILSERQKEELAEAERKAASSTSQTKSLQAENAGLRAKLEQLSAALADEKATTEALTKSAASVPAKENENTAALSRKYNMSAAILYALSVTHHDIKFGGMHKPDLGPVLKAIEQAGLEVNRATLERHLLHGAQHISK